MIIRGEVHPCLRRRCKSNRGVAALVDTIPLMHLSFLHHTIASPVDIRKHVLVDILFTAVVVMIISVLHIVHPVGISLPT